MTQPPVAIALREMQATAVAIALRAMQATEAAIALRAMQATEVAIALRAMQATEVAIALRAMKATCNLAVAGIRSSALQSTPPTPTQARAPSPALKPSALSAQP